MLHQKDESYKYALPLKKWVDWISMRREKNITISNMYFLRERTWKIEKILILQIMATFHNFPLVMETSLAETVVKPEKINVYVWFYLFILG